MKKSVVCLPAIIRHLQGIYALSEFNVNINTQGKLFRRTIMATTRHTN